MACTAPSFVNLALWQSLPPPLSVDKTLASLSIFPELSETTQAILDEELSLAYD
jgi:hypothetical protein